MASSTDSSSRQQIPWLRIGAEGVAIVVSILLAFGIQAWWEERGDGLRRDALLEGLANDMELASQEHDRVAYAHSEALKAGLSIVDLGAGATLSDLDAPMIDSLVSATRDGSSFDAPLGSLSALLSSGDLEQLDDYDLVVELTSFPALIMDLDREQTILIGLLEQFSDYLETEGIDTSHLVLNPGASPPWASAPTQAFTLVGAPRFRGLMSRVWFRYRNTSAKLETISQAIDRIRLRLAP